MQRLLKGEISATSHCVHHAETFSVRPFARVARAPVRSGIRLFARQPYPNTFTQTLTRPI